MGYDLWPYNIIHENFQEDRKSIAMSSIKYLNFKFYDIKLCIKNKFIDQIVNNIQFEWNLTNILRAWDIWKPTVRFSKFISHKNI